MAMNPQSVLADLRMMSDQQLQQYAAMHKNDPFVFPLAFQESQMRKQMRSEAQAMQQPQAKVADQALASMMPEEVGIGALPAQNLEGMAAGGIVAFDEGGEVPRYNGNTPAGSVIYSPEGIPFTGIPGDTTDSDLTLLERLGIRNPANRRALEAITKKPVALTPPKPSSAYTPSVEGMLNTATGTALGLQGASAAGNQAPPPAPPGPPAPPKAPTIAPTSFKPAEAPSLTSAKELAGQLLDSDSYKSEIDKYAKAEQDAVDAMRKARTEGKPQGKAYEEYEATLREETKDLGRQKGEAQGEAWLTAGLAVLGGSSPFALQNLGLATKGVEQYRDAMKDIRKATRENAKGLADIAQARRSEERGDWEKTQEFEERANTRMSNARKFGIEGLMTLGVKSADLAGRAYDTQVTQAGMDRRTMAELQSRENIANAQIQAQRALAGSSGQLGLFRELGGGDAAKGLGVYANVMGPEARGLQGLLAKYADPMKLMALKTTDPDLYNYVRAQLSMQMMPGVMSKPTGPVRD